MITKITQIRASVPEKLAAEMQELLPTLGWNDRVREAFHCYKIHRRQQHDARHAMIAKSLFDFHLRSLELLATAASIEELQEMLERCRAAHEKFSDPANFDEACRVAGVPYVAS